MNASLKTLVLGVICSVGLHAVPAPAAGPLVHRYSFNDGTANDSIGKAHGKLVAGATVADGKAHFNGTRGQRIELLAGGTDGININSYQAVTLEAWYTVDKYQAWQRIFDFGTTSAIDKPDRMGAHYLFYCPASQFEDARAAISDTGYQDEATISIPSLPVGQQYQVAVVVDASTVTLYINGTSAAQKPLGNRSLAKLSNDLAFLAGSMFGADAGLLGSIDEFRIYDTALSAEQLLASFAAGPNKLATGK